MLRNFFPDHGSGDIGLSFLGGGGLGCVGVWGATMNMRQKEITRTPTDRIFHAEFTGMLGISFQNMVLKILNFLSWEETSRTRYRKEIPRTPSDRVFYAEFTGIIRFYVPCIVLEIISPKVVSVCCGRKACPAVGLSLKL
jgi:hypothetical protein